jgi:hypothetical protein
VTAIAAAIAPPTWISGGPEWRLAT